jgi:ABC-type Mn2+/Zn2+ transport system permease subunit
MLDTDEQRGPVSFCFGTAAAVLGILISDHHDSATSATMALCSVVLFFVVLTLVAVRRSISGRGANSPTAAEHDLTRAA